MASPEEIAHQQTLLTTYRRNLAHYLKQQATLGEAYAPPAVMNGISEARSNIQRIKQILRGWQIAVEDLPDDGDPQPSLAPVGQPSPTTRAVDRVALRNILVHSFSDEELRDLVFDMGEDYENLPGSNKSGKAREMVSFAERRNRLDELMALIQRLRPDIIFK